MDDKDAREPGPVSSPCIGVCTVEGEHCTGCGRSLEEIGAWLSYSEEERRRIMAELPARLAADGD